MKLKRNAGSESHRGATALVTLVVLGGTAAYTGGASIVRGATRVAFWGVLAMALTAGVGTLLGAVA